MMAVGRLFIAVAGPQAVLSPCPDGRQNVDTQGGARRDSGRRAAPAESTSDTGVTEEP
ncbi:hypothetical protein [Streptomyces sp. Tue6028]|uniref:hypothetical protein n=1 Tax=Streptomyces sp. Tue6028 TaxID=2036037 RepID=UPI003D737B06